MSYTVTPDGNGWKVTKNGRTVSTHRLKRRAVETATQKASPGNVVQIRRSDGTIQDRRRVR
jgi:hypothetical protein